jgi:hypothetical protein
MRSIRSRSIWRSPQDRIGKSLHLRRLSCGATAGARDGNGVHRPSRRSNQRSSRGLVGAWMNWPEPRDTNRATWVLNRHEVDRRQIANPSRPLEIERRPSIRTRERQPSGLNGTRMPRPSGSRMEGGFMREESSSSPRPGRVGATAHGSERRMETAAGPHCIWGYEYDRRGAPPLVRTIWSGQVRSPSSALNEPMRHETEQQPEPQGCSGLISPRGVANTVTKQDNAVQNTANAAVRWRNQTQPRWGEDRATSAAVLPSRMISGRTSNPGPVVPKTTSLHRQKGRPSGQRLLSHNHQIVCIARRMYAS